MGRLKDALHDMISKDDTPLDYLWDAESQAAAVERVQQKQEVIAPMDLETIERRKADAAKWLATEGRKDDSGKSWRPGLIATEFIRGIATVLAFGAHKYSAGNWALGMDWSRPIDALDRHWTAWKGGEKVDAETGYSHLWHAGCCLMFLVAYEARGIGRDDREEVGMKGKS